MRGGSIPLLIWGVLLGLLMATNWVWTGDSIQFGSLAFAILVIWLGAGLAAVFSRRESLRRGPPKPRLTREAIPTSSLGAALLGVSSAAILFGFTFGSFLVFMGGGLFVASLGLIVREHRHQRRARLTATERDGSGRF